MDSVTQFYSKISTTYDLMNCVVYSSRLLKRIVELAEIKNGNRVLDLACGTGWISMGLEREGLDIDLNGIDLTPAMLLKAKKRTGGEFLIGKAEAMPYKDESFDVLICNMAFSHFDCPAAVEEVCRVLKAGGRFVFAEGTDPMPSLYDALVYPPARLAVRLLWLAAGRPSHKSPCDEHESGVVPGQESKARSKSPSLKPEDILAAFGKFMDAKVELRYDLLGPASRYQSGCWVIFGRKR